MQMKHREKLIAIVGPTAVGKTNLSLALAKKLDTEIISGDSMLVYRGLDIGTAKPSAAEQVGVVHHLIDILPPEEDFSVTRFKVLAEEKISEINRKGKIPILVGGTGLYVKSLVEDYQFNQTSGDDAYRADLEALAEIHGKAYVHAMLAHADPESAARLHVNDFRRVVRALEVYHQGGEKISQDKGGAEALAYDVRVIGLSMERNHLYERINHRVELMLEAGLIGEVKHLLESGVPREAQSMKGIGYKEIIAYLQGEASLEAAVNTLKKSTRHFAKRQLTWFRKMPYIQWYDTEIFSQEIILEKVYKSIAGYFLIK